jgi:CRISPR-associated protein Cas2
VRSRYLVTYDVRESKRLRRMFKTLRGFGDALQYSVFQCDLSDQERIAMLAALTGIMKADEDQVLIVDLGPSEGRGAACYEVLGCQRPPEEAGAVIV